MAKYIKIVTRFFLRFLLIFIELVFASLFVLLLFILNRSEINPPSAKELKISDRIEFAPNHYVIGPNYLRKNELGIWELYVEGTPYERGLIYGKLAKELVNKQEDIFVAQINRFVPSEIWQQFLRLMIGFFNSDLPKHIPIENQLEIYGISQSFSDKYNYIAPKYARILNYHAAHDIGHALNDYSMVGCTSFALKGKKTEKGQLMIGRNFDFYVGDDFAKEKVLLLMNPTDGYKFISYSWAGFTGVASGLNEKGICVTINASKSDLPTGAKMPISLLAREILQYAGSIQEAIAIAKKRQVFVSETLMIGSAVDKKAVLIEKSPAKMGIYDSDSDALICANHYQSKRFITDVINKENYLNSDSKYRYFRVKQLLKTTAKHNQLTILDVLRDQYAMNNDSLGMGNPRAINQLQAHHSVIILPESQQFYISTTDFQLGKFIGYDLQKSFAKKFAIASDTLPASAFLATAGYQKYKLFRKIKKEISDYLLFDTKLSMSENEVNRFRTLNNESYVTHTLLGKYYLKKGNKKKAKECFVNALTKKVASKQEEDEIKELIKACQRK